MKCKATLAVVIISLVISARIVLADIFRTNGELIPGTEGIVPGSGVQLPNFDLHQAKLNGVNLTVARFEGSNLTGANFSGTNLSSANLRNANLSEASFRQATLSNADFTGSVVTYAIFHRAFLQVNQLYSTASYQQHDLTGINFSGTGDNDRSSVGFDFSNQNLTGARFDWVQLGGNFTNANLTNASFGRVRIFTPMDISFNNAVIKNTSFGLAQGFSSSHLYSTVDYKNHDLSGLNLENLNLAGWNFVGQNLTGTRSPSRRFPANLGPCRLQGATGVSNDVTRFGIDTTGHIGSFITNYGFGMLVQDYPIGIQVSDRFDVGGNPYRVLLEDAD